MKKQNVLVNGVERGYVCYDQRDHSSGYNTISTYVELVVSGGSKKNRHWLGGTHTTGFRSALRSIQALAEKLGLQIELA